MTIEDKQQLANDILGMLVEAGYDPPVSIQIENTIEYLTEQELDELLNYASYKLKRPRPIPHL